MMTHRDRQGNPMEFEAWVEAFHKTDRRILTTEFGKDHHGCRQFVSTVWIGIEGQVFETMVFGGELDGYQVRYDTEHEARLGHVSVLNKVRATLPPGAIVPALVEPMPVIPLPGEQLPEDLPVDYEDHT
jgi:hypothetical protein